MGIWDRLTNRSPAAAPVAPQPVAGDAPQNATQSATGGVVITTPYELAEYLKTGNTSKSGARVTVQTAMQVAAVYACVRIISGSVATLPLDIKRRVDDRTRASAENTPLWSLINRSPNRWQKPSQFRRMLQAHVLLRGNAYCHKVVSRGEVRELIPLNPDPGRMKVTQNQDTTLRYEYKLPNGGTTVFKQAEIFHLHGLTLDGINGVSPLTFARETIGESLSATEAGATQFRTGPRVGGVLSSANSLSQGAIDRLKGSLDDYRVGGESEGKFLILEEGLQPQKIGLSAADAQWIEARKFSRSEIAMFFGVPPFMIGDTEKSTSWGTGLESQKDGYVTFTLEDHLTMWEETITLDLARDPKLYATFVRNALVRGNINDRWAAYVRGLQWGVYSPNEVRSLEDDNPREGGDVYYPPPNTAGGNPNDKSSDAGAIGNNDKKEQDQ